MKFEKLVLLPFLFSLAFQSKAQSSGCTLAPPTVTIHFGSGHVGDLNATAPPNYERVTDPCPNDGSYSYTPSTSGCFHDRWFTLPEDHTPGDKAGNMMLVNGSYERGQFLMTPINGLKSNTTYEFAVWLMNVCSPNQRCPSLLLPDIVIRLQTPTGKVVAQFRTGGLLRHAAPHWTRYRATFTTPPSLTSLTLVMTDIEAGGCGNDFAMDDITFRECVQPQPVKTTTSRPPVAAEPKPPIAKPVRKEPTPRPVRSEVKKQVPVVKTIRRQKDTLLSTVPVKQQSTDFPPPPALLITRENPLVERILTEAGDIRIDLYDNGQIDGDSVSIYHNNVLVVSGARLSQQPITFRITVDAAHPHHELVMSANNLGSIPPNTSLMIVTAGDKRYKVFISSTEQKNAKVVLDLKE